MDNTKSSQTIVNRIADHQRTIGITLSKLAWFIHPDIIKYIRERNNQEREKFSSMFGHKVDLDHYLYPGSPCLFPGVKRFINGQGKKRHYSHAERAILDDNIFPRHIWSQLKTGSMYSGDRWKESQLNQFELAHIFAHKESETGTESSFFSSVADQRHPHGQFTNPANTVLLPKGVVRPTDNNPVIKAIFYQHYVDEYGENTLDGLKGLDPKMLPDWYDECVWNPGYLPDGWEQKVDDLLDSRMGILEDIMKKANPAESN